MSHMDRTLGIVSDDALRRAAAAEHARDGELEIDPDKVILHTQEGAWVPAWVWVPYEDVRST